jgi:cell division protein FtsB
LRGAYDNSDIVALREENAALAQKIDELASAIEDLKADAKHK